MKSDKRQTLFMIGIVLLALAGIMIYVSLSAPRVYNTKNETPSARQTKVSESETVHFEAENEESVSYPVNLNTATVEELMTIEGLGEVRANAIVAYRNKIGKYEDVSQIMNIKGIGEELYYEFAQYLEV